MSFDDFFVLENNHALSMPYPESANFETCTPRILKFHIYGGLHKIKKC